MLYLITGQKKEFWNIYFKNVGLVYDIWGLMFKRGLALRHYYVKRYGFVVGNFLVLNHFRLPRLKVPFRYYKSFEGFVVRNVGIGMLCIGLVYSGISNFNRIKLWFVEVCPDPVNVVYSDYYYPYSIFLVWSIVVCIELLVLLSFKSIRFALSRYKYELLVINFIGVFSLITVHCTVAHEGFLYVWWIPESYEMISFTSEEEIVMEYWSGELKYFYNSIISPVLLDIKLIFEWAYIILYKAL